MWQEVSLEEVERLTEDSAEAKEYEERVRTLLGEALTAEDDAAVLQELSQLEKAEEAEEAAQLPRVPKVGSADSSATLLSICFTGKSPGCLRQTEGCANSCAFVKDQMNMPDGHAPETP